ncbi:MAG: SPOR domain-containing protein [Bacteroidota bacterium]
MNTRLTLACVLLGAAICPGCGSTDDVSQQTDQEKQPQPQAAAAQPPVSIETRTDTIASIHQQVPEPETAPRLPALSNGLYRVQVGAFRKAANATTWENFSKKRLGQPAVSEYSERLGVYRVRVGAFETMREVLTFWRKIRKEYPKEFGDAWVIIPGRE